MSEPLAAARPDFFGKDSFCPFVGQVEDVNDPNQSGRVKVRCVGWHPFNRGEAASGEGTGEGAESLATEDLPWARVGMPVTHAQQARIGGKHGLRVGCWVMGFFVDGEEAQDPFIICTFNHTAKVSEQDNRKDEAGETGTLPNETQGFTKLATDENLRNVSRLTEEEQGQGGYAAEADPAGDTITNDNQDGDCGSMESVASKRRMKDQLKKDSADGNPESQKYPANVGDGRCGRPQHAMTDTMKVIQENMPAAAARFAYGDKVWEVTSGNNINLNGTFNQMAQQISGFMKGPIMSSYQLIEEFVNRNTRSTTIIAIPDEVGDARIVADKAKNVADDAAKVAFAIFPLGPGLFQAILQLLQELDNLGLETLGENLTGIIGAGGSTGISNTSARCIAESLIESIEALTNIQIENSQAVGDELFEQLMNGGLNAFLDLLSGSMGAAGAIGSVIQMFLTIESFSTNPKVFHAGGTGTQDQRNVQGCTPERVYQTDQGYLPTIPSIGGGAGGFGGIPGIGGGIFPGIGFGGLPIIGDPQVNTVPCEDALTEFFPDDPNNPLFPDIDGEDDDFGGDLTGRDLKDRPGEIEEIKIIGPKYVQRNRRAEYVAQVKMNKDRYDDFNRYYWTVDPEERLITNASNAEMSSDITVAFRRPGKYKLTVTIENDRAKNTGSTKSFTLVVRNAHEMPKGDVNIIPGLNTYPNGKFAILKAISEPSSDPEAAQNFILGVPNQVVVINPGKNYHFRNDVNPENAFPTFFVRGYQGTPIPVIDKNSGEFVALLTAPISFSDDHPKVPITVIPDNNNVGILSQDPDYDIELGGFYIQNTGRGYKLPTINIIDKDTELENGDVEPVVVDGRIVDVIIKNSGRNFKRIPRLEIIDDGKSKLLKELESEMEKRGLAANIRNKGDKPR